MKFVFFLIIIYILPIESNCQSTLSAKGCKLVIDSTAYGKWPEINQLDITDDGKFVSCVINNIPFGGFSAIIKESLGPWELRLPNVKYVKFTEDSKRAFYIDTSSTLHEVKLQDRDVEIRTAVESFILSSAYGMEWIVCKDLNADSLVLLNTKTTHKTIFHSVDNFTFSENGKVLLLQTHEMVSGAIRRSLKWVDMKNMSLTDVWSGSGIASFRFNTDATKLAFVPFTEDTVLTSIWLYDNKIKSTSVFVDLKSNGMFGGMQVDDLTNFDSEDYLFIKVRKHLDISKSKLVNSTVCVWSYLDVKLQPLQMSEINYQPEYLAAINLRNRQIVQISGDNEMIWAVNYPKATFLIAHSGGGDPGEFSWNDSSKISYRILSLNENKRGSLEFNGRIFPKLSPDGKYIVYYDNVLRNYFSYEISKGVKRNITDGISANFISKFWEDELPRARGIAGWVKDEGSVLIYDRFDIWKVSLTGEMRPINLTNGYGIRNNVVFDLALWQQSGSTLSAKDSLILVALNLSTKQNGFFKTTLRKQSDPILSYMGDCIFNMAGNPYGGASAIFYPIKAKNAKKYIVKRMSSTDYPNYYFTMDFRTFLPLTDFNPEKSYNWYTTELHTWHLRDGSLNQGILYKPENFDSTKKYSVIINYYDKVSYKLNLYIYPDNLSQGCDLNIPTYVSNGYLVFTPDISYVIGNPMQGTLDAVVSAANYLSSLPYVNKDRLGIGGCSFGAIQTNYLVTHTNRFKAAYSASGMSNLVSAYGGLLGGTSSMQGYFDGGQGRMLGPLSKYPEQYIQNSAIFNADKVVTPLLLMHTPMDQISSFSQAVEFFTALRRLGKKVWMLEYIDGTHGVWGESAKDFGVRLRQFLDHYLMDRPAPMWMTRGLPGKMKGIEDGLQLDMDIKTPEQSLLRE